MSLRLLGLEALAAQRPLGLEQALDALEQRVLALALLLADAQLLAEPLHAVLDDGEVVEDELGLEVAQVARRVHAVGRGLQVALEVAHHGQERVAVAHAREQVGLGGRAGRERLAAAAGRAAVHELDLRVGGLLRLEDRGEPVHALVGHAHHAQLLAPRLGGVRPGALHEDLEERALAGARQTEDADTLHGVPRRTERDGPRGCPAGRQELMRRGSLGSGAEGCQSGGPARFRALMAYSAARAACSRAVAFIGTSIRRSAW